MSESLANLVHRENIQTFKFDVTNVSITSSWGGVALSGNLTFDTGINLTGKKIFCNYVPTSGGAWINVVSVLDNTKLVITLVRGASGTTTGKLYVMVTD